MNKFRTALLAITVAFTVAGGTGAAASIDAKPAGKSSIVKTTDMRTGSGGGWCC